MTTRNNTILALALMIIAALSFAGCSRSVEPKAEAQQRVTGDPRPKGNATPREVFLCGAPTKAGGTCKRHVKAKGELCWMHRK